MLKEAVQKHGAGNWILGIVCVCMCARVCCLSVCTCVCVHYIYNIVYSGIRDTRPYWTAVHASVAESSNARH